MEYIITYQSPEKHFIDIAIKLQPSEKVTKVQLPVWRPGRYELGNFAKNVREFYVVDENNNPVSFCKTSKDCWVIETDSLTEIRISYRYYANTLNAGSTYLDENQLYINPVNCCIYEVGKEEQSCILNLYNVMGNANQIAGLDSKITNGMYIFDSFHSLADSPFIISVDLQHQSYQSEGISFHIWFQGIVKPDWKKIITDFQKFTDFQINAFGKFPSEEYHFLFQITPYKAYHGVEHINSTVLLLGPSYDLFDTLYTELLGLCSHELYHAWNVKAIRPAEMSPYNYASENYFQTGFVAEGVTTYLGDRILFECGVFDREQYTKELSAYIHKHFHNDGRKYYSVAASSFDTWLDGYDPGIPGRKTSIYTEGCLIAYICDMRIRKATENKSSLHTVMLLLFEQTATESGYTATNYQQILEKVAGESFDDIFQQLVYSTSDFEPFLMEALQFDGYSFSKKTAKGVEQYGIKVQNTMEGFEITNVLEGSAAYLSGLVEGDKIIAVNDVMINNNLTLWTNFFTDDEFDLFLTIHRKGIIDQLAILAPNDLQYYSYELKFK